jgi:hypothetical protein
MAGGLIFDRQVTLKASLNHRAEMACSCFVKIYIQLELLKKVA